MNNISLNNAMIFMYVIINLRLSEALELMFCYKILELSISMNLDTVIYCL